LYFSFLWLYFFFVDDRSIDFASFRKKKIDKKIVMKSLSLLLCVVVVALLAMALLATAGSGLPENARAKVEEHAAKVVRWKQLSPWLALESPKWASELNTTLLNEEFPSPVDHWYISVPGVSTRKRARTSGTFSAIEKFLHKRNVLAPERFDEPSKLDRPVKFFWNFAHMHMFAWRKNKEWYTELGKSQVICTFPGFCNAIASKSSFALFYMHMVDEFGVDVVGAWHPETYVMHSADHRRRWQLRAIEAPDFQWIVKPSRASEARGVRMLAQVPLGVLGKDEEQRKVDAAAYEDDRLAELAPVGDQDIVQRYIDNPLLMDDRKFTLRFEVLITSLYPLRMYMHWNGKVKISTIDWDPSSEVKGSHVTNTAYQKKLDTFEVDDAATDSEGPMRSVRWFLEEYMEPAKAASVMNGIDKVMVKSVLSILPSARNITVYNAGTRKVGLLGPDHAFKGFHVVGGDIEFTENWEPILLEQNCSPRLVGHRDLPWENEFFRQVYAGMFDTSGIVSHDFVRHLAAIKDGIAASIPDDLKVADRTLEALALEEYELPLATRDGYRRLFPPLRNKPRYQHYLQFIKQFGNLDAVQYLYNTEFIDPRPSTDDHLSMFPTPTIYRQQHPGFEINSQLIDHDCIEP
jgi:Tubulin-tyrosine ligase family